jgi:peptide/nickel transport system substrate-binding protein
MVTQSIRKVLKPWIGMAALLSFILIPFITFSSAEQPRRGGTLVVSTNKDPSTLNPALTTDMNVHHVFHDFYEALIELDGEFIPRPGLAESWEVSPDGLAVTFHLKKNVIWHDGKPFTSKDVQFGLMEVAGKYNPLGRKIMATVRSIETPDDHTAVFRMKKVFGPLIPVNNAWNLPIVPRHLYGGTDILKNPHNVDNPVGTGPFKFKEWVKGDHITFVRNDDYHKPGLPYLDRIIFSIIRDPSSRALAFEKGELDVLGVGGALMHDFVRLKSLPNVTTSPTPGDPVIVLIAFNRHDNKILANKKVRHAIYHAIDRQFISNKARNGVSPPLHTPIPPVFGVFHNPNTKKYEYDPAKAEKLLDEAGYPRGTKGVRFSLSLVHEYGRGHGVVPAAQMIKPMLKKVGIEVKIVPMERPVMFEKAFKNYEFDLFLTTYGGKGDPAAGIARCYTTSSILGKPFSNVARYSNPEVDRLFDEGAASMDQNTRAKAYHKVQEILTDELPYMWVFAPGSMDTVIAQSKVKEVFQTIHGPRYDNVWLAGER